MSTGEQIAKEQIAALENDLLRTGGGVYGAGFSDKIRAFAKAVLTKFMNFMTMRNRNSNTLDNSYINKIINWFRHKAGAEFAKWAKFFATQRDAAINWRKNRSTIINQLSEVPATSNQEAVVQIVLAVMESDSSLDPANIKAGVAYAAVDLLGVDSTEVVEVLIPETTDKESQSTVTNEKDQTTSTVIDVLYAVDSLPEIHQRLSQQSDELARIFHDKSITSEGTLRSKLLECLIRYTGKTESQLGPILDVILPQQSPVEAQTGGGLYTTYTDAIDDNLLGSKFIGFMLAQILTMIYFSIVNINLFLPGGGIVVGGVFVIAVVIVRLVHECIKAMLKKIDEYRGLTNREYYFRDFWLRPFKKVFANGFDFNTANNTGLRVDYHHQHKYTGGGFFDKMRFKLKLLQSLINLRHEDEIPSLLHDISTDPEFNNLVSQEIITDPEFNNLVSQEASNTQPSGGGMSNNTTSVLRHCSTKVDTHIPTLLTISASLAMVLALCLN